MKYENIKLKKELSQAEYISLVDALVSIQIFENESGELEYHPQYLTTTLPSIIALYCLDGIEFAEDDVLFDKDFIDKLNADKIIHAITNFMIFDDEAEARNLGYFQIPFYYYKALEDADAIVRQKLKDATASGKLLKLVSAFMAGAIDGLKNSDIQKSFNELADLVNNDDRKLN